MLEARWQVRMSRLLRGIPSDRLNGRTDVWSRIFDPNLGSANVALKRDMAAIAQCKADHLICFSDRLTVTPPELCFGPSGTAQVKAKSGRGALIRSDPLGRWHFG